ncbi:D-alanyl-D-alanine carboxypeptidase family protein [Salisediminibacterium halotolerans]|uniref:serine-type D-Ala-D-Ala carboxypeptidase n=1 Tax=Salisediminibacterium halotolerans TaxID=517425 RepID=A0A1H9WDM2_9BACI|nr:D-alanyl-D-alanine carboxypeptidase family protein [Salisediminibacterium haloalkalitolerans]SES31563.1 D-alanyl-D-alanine carboxypeptidase (penicillin-binding protein 5/6) [Salisediminibacterium haloalkalitolerans]
MLKKTGLLSLASLITVTGVFTYQGEAEASYDPSVENAVLIDAETGRVLYNQNADEPLPPASMTKMMSEYIILEAVNEGEIDWDTEVPVNDFLAEFAHDPALSNVPMNTDTDYTVKELYESVAIYSANAATMALAELISGSEGEFVERMNETGEEIGLGTTLREAGEEYGLSDLEEIAAEGAGDFQFVNSTGLPNRLLEDNYPDGTEADEDNYMTAKAAATLGYHLVTDYPEVLETASIDEKTFREGTDDEITMQNWNWMIPGTQSPDLDYERIDGLKTGHTNDAGFTFTGTAEKDGQRLISVVMGADSESHRFEETEEILEWGFDTFSEEEIFSENMTLDGYETAPVAKGEEDEVSVASTEAVTRVIEDGEEELYSYTVEWDEDSLNEDGELEAPVESGDVVGEMHIEYNGDEEESYILDDLERSMTVDVAATESVDRLGWFSLTMHSIGNFFSGLWTSISETVRGWL